MVEAFNIKHESLILIDIVPWIWVQLMSKLREENLQQGIQMSC